MRSKPILPGPQANTQRPVDSGSAIRRIPGRNRFKADVFQLSHGDDTIAVKTFCERPWWLRNIWGRFWILRERKALRAAQGLPGAQLLLEDDEVSPLTIRTAWIDGVPLADQPPLLPSRVAERLGAVVGGFHERGIALGDLHHRDVLANDRGDVYVVDLATAFVLGHQPGRLRRRLFRHLTDQDRIAVARIQARLEGRDEASAIQGVGPAAARNYLRARRWKSRWDRIRGKR